MLIRVGIAMRLLRLLLVRIMVSSGRHLRRWIQSISTILVRWRVWVSGAGMGARFGRRRR